MDVVQEGSGAGGNSNVEYEMMQDGATTSSLNEDQPMDYASHASQAEEQGYEVMMEEQQDLTEQGEIPDAPPSTTMEEGEGGGEEGEAIEEDVNDDGQDGETSYVEELPDEHPPDTVEQGGIQDIIEGESREAEQVVGETSGYAAEEATEPTTSELPAEEAYPDTSTQNDLVPTSLQPDIESKTHDDYVAADGEGEGEDGEEDGGVNDEREERQEEEGGGVGEGEGGEERQDEGGEGEDERGDEVEEGGIGEEGQDEREDEEQNAGVDDDAGNVHMPADLQYQATVVEVDADDGVGEEYGAEGAEDEEESSTPPSVRVTFNGQDFVLFPHAEPPTYVSAQEEEPVAAPQLKAEPRVFYETLDSLFEALRIKDSLGDFLEEGSELQVKFVDLDMVVREDDVYAREVTLNDVHRLHLGYGLLSSMHLIVSEAGRFISRYNELAAHVSSLLERQDFTLEEGDDNGANVVEEEGEAKADDGWEGQEETGGDETGGQAEEEGQDGEAEQGETQDGYDGADAAGIQDADALVASHERHQDYIEESVEGQDEDNGDHVAVANGADGDRAEHQAGSLDDTFVTVNEGGEGDGDGDGDEGGDEEQEQSYEENGRGEHIVDYEEVYDKNGEAGGTEEAGQVLEAGKEDLVAGVSETGAEAVGRDGLTAGIDDEYEEVATGGPERLKRQLQADDEGQPGDSDAKRAKVDEG